MSALKTADSRGCIDHNDYFTVPYSHWNGLMKKLVDCYHAYGKLYVQDQPPANDNE